MVNYQTSQAYRPCPECGGERVPAETWGNGYIQLRKPGTSGLFGGTTLTWALVCISCGYISFYAKEPGKLINKRPDKPAK